ncbi:helix-turn-helix domain-containing protein [Variovorax ginsengisoli]|uniref:Helix-turn-helix domain-containing protein n=2 Tax=Variovorax ginsengisoli TaxID=363844 RepID=A0ABT8S973_9BURK|nr:helix-turn-helix domain-containing protein [Variovorax ginsengisoli]MDN8616170.1 helix-turn-helix domain-containing protein [Variovorax ginsengisoli]MDO1535340.1 helix-turn-helix domain-containing protein [Variovorax ginsengisoli]
MAQNYECASLDSLPVRVARQLLLSGTMQLRTAEQDDPDQSQIQMSQSDLAAMVGASRQSVNRVLQQLREKHVIEISYLPKYAGNLDIMAAAASRTA